MVEVKFFDQPIEEKNTTYQQNKDQYYWLVNDKTTK